MLHPTLDPPECQAVAAPLLLQQQVILAMLGLSYEPMDLSFPPRPIDKWKLFPASSILPLILPTSIDHGCSRPHPGRVHCQYWPQFRRKAHYLVRTEQELGYYRRALTQLPALIGVRQLRRRFHHDFTACCLEEQLKDEQGTASVPGKDRRDQLARCVGIRWNETRVSLWC